MEIYLISIGVLRVMPLVFLWCGLSRNFRMSLIWFLFLWSFSEMGLWSLRSFTSWCYYFHWRKCWLQSENWRGASGYNSLMMSSATEVDRRCTSTEPDSWYLFNHCRLQWRCITRHLCQVKVCVPFHNTILVGAWMLEQHLLKRPSAWMVLKVLLIEIFVDTLSEVLEFSFPCMACHGFFIKITKYNLRYPLPFYITCALFLSKFCWKSFVFL